MEQDEWDTYKFTFKQAIVYNHISNKTLKKECLNGLSSLKQY